MYKRQSCVTAKLEVNYITPVPVEEEFELEAWVTKIEGKKLYLESSISSNQNIHIEGSGLFIDLGNYPGQLFKENKNYP